MNEWNIENLLTDIDILWTGFWLNFADDKIRLWCRANVYSGAPSFDRFFKFVSQLVKNIVNLYMCYI